MNASFFLYWFAFAISNVYLNVNNIIALSNREPSKLGLVAHFNTDSAIHALVHSVAMWGGRWISFLRSSLLPPHTYTLVSFCNRGICYWGIPLAQTYDTVEHCYNYLCAIKGFGKWRSRVMLSTVPFVPITLCITHWRVKTYIVVEAQAIGGPSEALEQCSISSWEWAHAIKSAAQGSRPTVLSLKSTLFVHNSPVDLLQLL